MGQVFADSEAAGGAIIGERGLRLIKLQAKPNPAFGALWLVEVPVQYGLTELAFLYALLKRHTEEIVQGTDGTLLVSLLGVDVNTGVIARDAYEEVLGLVAWGAERCSALKAVTLQGRDESFAELQSQLMFLHSWRGLGLVQEITTADLKPHLKYLMQFTENADFVDEVLRTSLQEALREEPSQILRVCKAGHQIAERLLQLLGAPEKEGGLSPGDVQELVAMRQLAPEFLEYFVKLIRVGNKADDASLVETLTYVDAVLSLLCMIAILIAVYTHNQPQHQQGGGPGAEGFGAGGGEGGRHAGFKEGDWICPSPGCGDHQFARNARCRRCGFPKPGTDGSAGGGGQGGQGGGGGRGQGGQGGEGWTSFKQDWECAQCGDYQFARNAICRRCGAERPDMEGAEGEQAPKPAHGGQGPNGGGGGGGGGGGRREGRMANAKPGDWMCPRPGCNDVQFARNQNCRRCGEPKPANVGNAGGNFGGGGGGGGGSGGEGGGGSGGCSGGRGGGSGSAQKSHVKSQTPGNVHEGHITAAQRATWVLQYAAPATSVQGADDMGTCEEMRGSVDGD